MDTEGTEDPHHDGRCKTIVVALDKSDESFHALQWALETLTFDASDQLVLVHARTTPSSKASGFNGAVYVLGSEMVLSMEKSHEREIKAFMDKALELCNEKQVKTATHVEFGDPRDVICEQIEKLNANMLVIGSHGYGAVKRALLGSVSDYCAHHVKCPIVIVKKPKEDGSA
ncbi:hypothetical protein KP509_28G005900 [Ceratopteris richardii]|nr:hypothetical protein KP509_28G005900 [Ceratopteris richardii]